MSQLDKSNTDVLKDQAAVTDSDEEEFRIICDICKTSFSGTIPYEQHLKGSKHKKAYMKKKYGRKYLEVKAKLDGEEDPSASHNAQDEDSDDAVVIPCKICNKICTGYIPYQLHLASSSHTKQVKKQKLIEQLKKEKLPFDDEPSDHDEPLYDTAPQIKPFASCKICKKTFSGPKNYRQHQNSDSHKKELIKQNLMQQMEGEGETFNKDKKQADSDSSDELIKPFAQCKECNKSFSGPLPYKQHMISDAHKRQLKNLKYMDKMKDLTVNSEDGNPLLCKTCGKSFSGVQPLKAHLNSGYHEKLLKKTKIMENLKNKFPEMVNDTVCEAQPMSNSHDGKHDSDNETGDINEILVCGICHKSFSGPESARDHFVSKKHIRAKKEKAKLEILKKQKQLNKGAKQVLIAKLKAKENGNAITEIKTKEESNLNETGNDEDKHVASDEFEFM